MCGFTLGVDLSPINLLPGLPQSQNPTGTSLITLMEEDHIRLIRLVGDAPGPVPVLMGMLHSGGWKTIFTELDSARIGVVLNLGGETAPNGTFDGDWSADPLQVPSSQAPEPTAQWISNEAGIIEDIKSQCDGVPPSLVAVEMANEPLLNPTTLPMIGQALAAIRSELPGIAVTVGGWRAPAIKAGTFWDYNDPADTGEIAPLVDYVSAHLYPDEVASLPDGEARNSTDPSKYLSASSGFIQRVIGAAGGKPIMIGEFGAPDGRPETVPLQPSGGSMAHQTAVIQAVIQTMLQESGQGVTGGTVWSLEQNAGGGYPCTPFQLICFGMTATPALQSLATAAAADNRS